MVNPNTSTSAKQILKLLLFSLPAYLWVCLCSAVDNGMESGVLGECLRCPNPGLQVCAWGGDQCQQVVEV